MSAESAADLSLRRELDELRLQNQQLHVALHELRLRNGRNAHPLGRGAATPTNQFRDSLRRIKRVVSGRRPTTIGATPAPPASTLPEPYRVRIRNPLESGRPRILHAIANFYIGGSSRLVVDLIERLGHRYEQEVLTRDVPPTPAYVGLPLHRERSADDAERMREHLRRFRPDLVHIHFLGHHRNSYSALDWLWYHQVFAAAEREGLRIVENINVPVPPYVSPMVARYVFVSETVRSRFGRLDAPNVTIYPGSDLDLFRRDEAQPDSPENCIGMVYRLEGDKLSEDSIDVFLEVVRRRPGTNALIVGGGRYLEPYRRRVAECGLEEAFTFTGYVEYDRLPDYLSRMTVFVAPVHTESFGQVSPFAMGMGLPVAGYRVGALPEILGSDAQLAPAGDTRRLADIVLDLLADREERVRTGEENRRRANELFTVEAMSRLYDGLYDEVLG